MAFLFVFGLSECGGGAQSSDGQHATQRRHARRTHAPGLLPSKEKGLLADFHPSPTRASTRHTTTSHGSPPPIAKPILLSPPPFLASLAVLIPVQMCSLLCLSAPVPYVHAGAEAHFFQLPKYEMRVRDR